MAKSKEKEMDNTSSEASKNKLNALLKGDASGHFNFINRVGYKISSGSLNLDTHITVKSGTTIRLGGPAEVGKTSQSILFAQNFMATVPKSKTLYINAEAKFGQEIKDRLGLKFTENPDEWEYGTVFVLQSNVFDTICNFISGLLADMHDNGEHLCIIIDSVDMLMLKSSLENGISDGKKPAGVNYLTKEMFRRLGHPIQSYDALLIMITQYSQTFTLDKYTKEPPKTMEGNNTHALNHQMSYGLYYRPRNNSSYILENPDEKKPDPDKNKILGIKVMIDLKKTATDETGYPIEVPIKKGVVGNAIWVEYEVVDMLLSWELVKKKGAWYSFDDETVDELKKAGFEPTIQHQGLDNLRKYLEENKDICKYFFEKFRTALAK